MFDRQPSAPFALPQRIPPLPLESLESFIYRAAIHMGYPQPSWILAPEEIPYAVKCGNVSLVRKVEDYHFLKTLLRLHEEAIYQLTLHHFATRLEEPGHGTRSRSADIDRPLLARDRAQRYIHSHR